MTSAITPPADPWRLDGKRALVTGASQGIGRATADELAAAGASVAVHYSRSEHEAGELATRLREQGTDVLLLRAELREPTEIQAMFARVQEEWGGVDILVNNAATTRDGFVMLASPESWDDVLDVNLRGAFLCAKHALRPMIRARWGRIVNLISPAALLGKEGAASYAASKGGLQSFTRSLAREVGRYGITVNAVCPGWIDTRMTESMPEEERRRQSERLALGRFGTPAEVARAIRFLASDAATYVTGVTLAVDGGPVMR